jgi:hypothetical protein
MDQAYRKHHACRPLRNPSRATDKQHCFPSATMISRFTKLFFCVVLALVRLPCQPASTPTELKPEAPDCLCHVTASSRRQLCRPAIRRSLWRRWCREGISRASVPSAPLSSYNCASCDGRCHHVEAGERNRKVSYPSVTPCATGCNAEM